MCGPSACSDVIIPAQMGKWEVLNPSQCLQAYANEFISDRSTVIVIGGDYTTNATFIVANTDSGGIVVDDGVVIEYIEGNGPDPFAWICSGMNDYTLCSSEWAQIDPSRWEIMEFAFDGTSTPLVQVNYCISQPTVEKCQLAFNLPFLAVVIIFNIVKVACMAIAAITIKDNALVTIGDAIASFTDDPDAYTKEMCLVSQSCFRSQNKNHHFSPLCLQHEPQKIRLWSVASRRHWIVTIFLYVSIIQLMIHSSSNPLFSFFIAISVTVALLGYAVRSLHSLGNGNGISALWQLGLGKPHPQTIISWRFMTEGYGALVTAVLISNSPQLILSLIYLIFNNLWTILFLSLEWSSYAHSHKPLRVSSPRGMQQSTYFLHIPYRFGLPLLAYSALLHWLVSQSIFLIEVQYWEDGRLDPSSSNVSCGYSPLGMILTVIVGVSLILGTLAFSCFKQLKNSMPLVGSCSAAISAACHPPANGADSLKPVKWGVVSDTDGDGKQSIGHISFSSGEVLPPIPGHYYS